MQQELISVIIPVYNVEQWLPRCLDSILNQTYSNMEILLIDDGSADHSGRICDEYAGRDKRIRVWHTDNQGPSFARNLGIEKAEGNYLLFVDGDDILSRDHVSFLYNLLSTEHADLSVCNYVATKTDDFLESKERQRLIWTGKEALKYLLYQRYFTTGPVCKLYHRGLFEQVRFPVGTLYEDTLTIAQVVGQAKKVVYSDAVKYGYFQRQGSTMRSAYRNETFQYVEVTSQLMEYVSDKFPDLEAAAISRFVWANLFVLIKMSCGNATEYTEKKNIIMENIKKYRMQVLKDSQVRAKNKIVLLLSFFGPGVLRTVYQMQR